jgi:hypothetical protein
MNSKTGARMKAFSDDAFLAQCDLLVMLLGMRTIDQSTLGAIAKGR